MYLFSLELIKYNIRNSNNNTNYKKVVVKPVDGPYLFEEQDVIRSQQPYTLFYP